MKKIENGPTGNVGLEAKVDPLSLTYSGFKKFGDYFKIQVLPGISWYVISDPAAAEHILVKNASKYRKPGLFTKAATLLMGRGVLSSTNTDEVSLARKQMIPLFQTRSLEKFQPEIRKFFEKVLHENLGETSTKKEIFKFFMDLNFSVFTQLLLGEDLSAQTSRGKQFSILMDHIHMRMHNPIYPPLWLPTKENQKFKKMKKDFDEFLLNIIENRINLPSKDILTQLLATFPVTTDSREKRNWLLDQLYTLLFASHDTTGTAFAWTLHLLTQHPSHLEKLNKDFSEGSDQYFKLVLNESLRLYPTAWSIPRVAKMDDEIKGWRIPKGKMIIISQYVIHRHPHYWENPEAFNPNRFENFDMIKNRYNYLPFGVGNRMCLGNHMTYVLGKELFSLLLENYDVKTLESSQNVPILSTSTLRAKNGITMEFYFKNR